jgi:hypothetical protein
LWRFGQLEVYLPSVNVSATLQYSIDKGDNWTTLGTIQKTLTGTLTSDGTTTVTGSGTDFTLELDVGDTLNLQGVSLTVSSVESDTSFTATGAVSATSGSAYHTQNQLSRKWYMSTQSGKVNTPRMRYRVVANSSSGTETPVVKSVVFWYLPEPEPNWIWDLTVGVAEEWELLDGTIDTQDLDTQISTLSDYARTQKIITFTDREGNTWDAMVWDFVEDYHVPGKAGEPNEGFLRLSVLEVADE